MSSQMSLPARSPVRTAAFYVWAILLYALVSATVGEVLVRLLVEPAVVPGPSRIIRTIDPFTANPYVVRMQPYLHLHVPGSIYYQSRAGYRVRYEINSRGFRGPEARPRAESGRRRLLVVGDSMVEGQGVEFGRTFSALLDREFRQQGWEVMNAGVQAASPLYYAANLERYLALDPDAVLVVLYENDLGDDRVLEQRFDELPYLASPPDVLGPSWIDELQASHLFAFVLGAWSRWDGPPLEPLVTRNRRRLEPLEQDEEQRAYREVAYYLIAPSVFDDHWLTSQRYLDSVLSALQRRGIDVMVSYLSVLALDRDASPEFRVHSALLDDRLARWADRHALAYMSLVPTIADLYRSRDPATVAIPMDGHLTDESHAAVAEALQPWLRQHLGQDGSAGIPSGR